MKLNIIDFRRISVSDPLYAKTALFSVENILGIPVELGVRRDLYRISKWEAIDIVNSEINEEEKLIISLKYGGSW